MPVSDLSTFGIALRDERKRMSLSQEAFAALGGVSKNSQLQYEAGKTPPTVEYLLKLNNSGINVAHLLGADNAAEVHLAQGRIASAARRPQPGGNCDQMAVDEEDLVPIAEIDLAYGLGGTYADADMQIETQIHRFPKAWLQSITHTPPSLLTFARGRGDSMRPTLEDGDIMLIDRSIRTVHEQDAIWALTVGDIAMIKRLRVKGDRVSIMSDNDRVSDDDCSHEDINIVGRVIFIGRRL